MLDKLMFGLQVTIICMVIVFLVLIALSFIISIQRVVVEKIEGLGSRNKGKKEVNNASAPPQSPVVKAAEEPESDELIAVISAAVAAALGRPNSKIIVRSIRRLEPASPAWNMAGRQEQINSRF